MASPAYGGCPVFLAGPGVRKTRGQSPLKQLRTFLPARLRYSARPTGVMAAP